MFFSTQPRQAAERKHSVSDTKPAEAKRERGQNNLVLAMLKSSHNTQMGIHYGSYVFGPAGRQPGKQ
jgi:hypothetical protein